MTWLEKEIAKIDEVLKNNKGIKHKRKYERWALSNILRNMLNKEKGLPPRPAEENPYLK